MTSQTRAYLILMAAVLLLVVLQLAGEGREAREIRLPLAASEAEQAGESPAEASEAAAPESDPLALEVIGLLNARRVEAQLWPLSPDATLERLAREQAEYLLGLPALPGGSELHTGPGGSQPIERAAAAGWPSYGGEVQVGATEITTLQPTPLEAVQWWMDEPSHKEIVVGAGYREVGAAVRPVEGGGNLYVVVLGARPDVLPALLDERGREVYLSDERVEWAAGGGGIQQVTQVQVVPPGEEPSAAGWEAWQLTLPAPGEGDAPFIVIYSDGTRQVRTQVRPGADVALVLNQAPAQ